MYGVLVRRYYIVNQYVWCIGKEIFSMCGELYLLSINMYGVLVRRYFPCVESYTYCQSICMGRSPMKYVSY